MKRGRIAFEGTTENHAWCKGSGQKKEYPTAASARAPNLGAQPRPVAHVPIFQKCFSSLIVYHAVK